MKGWGLVFLAWLAAFALVLTVLSSISDSQAPAVPTPQGPTCEALPACMNERVRDFRDLVEYLQSELAFCKAVNKGMNATLNEVRGELEAAKKKVPTEPPTEPPK